MDDEPELHKTKKKNPPNNKPRRGKLLIDRIALE